MPAAVATTAGAAAGAPTLKVPDIFPSKELYTLACTCEPDAVAAWDAMLTGRICARSFAAYKTLMYSPSEIAAMTPDARAVVHAYDGMLAGQLLATLQGDAPRVKLVRATIAAREKMMPGHVIGSGRAIRGIVLEIITPTCGSELVALEDELEKSFFNMSMSDTAVKLAALRLEALRAQLPPTARGGEREMLRALLDKFPPELAQKAAKYKMKMCTAEVRKREYDWTYQELTALLSAHIAARSGGAEANAAEPKGPGGGGGGGGGGGKPGTSDFKGCFNCGGDNHQARYCKAQPCAYCGLRYCFGARKRGPQPGCLVKKLVDGGEIGPSDLGLNAKPITESMIARLKERAEELKAKANETNTATQTAPDDELYEGDESD